MAISSMEPKIKASASSERTKVKGLGKDELEREEATQEEALLLLKDKKAKVIIITLTFFNPLSEGNSTYCL